MSDLERLPLKEKVRLGVGGTIGLVGLVTLGVQMATALAG
jgi:hypothetical protein